MYKLKFITKLILVLCVALSTPSFVLAIDYSLPPVDVSVSATVGTITVTPTDDGGGGFLTGIVFSGYAYPGATVHIWKNGLPKTTTKADETGRFSATITEIYAPNALYTLYAIDRANRRSLLINYPIIIKTGYITHVSGIRFAPTISTDKTEVKEGGDITVSGYALPSALLSLSIEGVRDRIFSLTSNSDGTYQMIVSLSGFRKGDYNVHTNYVNDKRISNVITFTIGEVNILSVDLTTNIPGDCNADQIINLIDFSVMAFWYGKDNPPRCVDTNKDNIINLVDFSILAFYWTG